MSTGYFSNSTGSSVTDCRFSPITGFESEKNILKVVYGRSGTLCLIRPTRPVANLARGIYSELGTCLPIWTLTLPTTRNWPSQSLARGSKFKQGIGAGPCNGLHPGFLRVSRNWNHMKSGGHPGFRGWFQIRQILHKVCCWRRRGSCLFINLLTSYRYIIIFPLGFTSWTV